MGYNHSTNRFLRTHPVSERMCGIIVPLTRLRFKYVVCKPTHEKYYWGANRSAKTAEALVLYRLDGYSRMYVSNY